jgi:hypothetical protein
MYTSAPAGAAAAPQGLGTQLLDAFLGIPLLQTAPAAPTPAPAPTFTVPQLGEFAALPPVGAGAAAPAVAAAPVLPTILRAPAAVAASYASHLMHGAAAVITHATHKGQQIWAGVHNPQSIHITQVPSRFNRAPAAFNRDCGPASVVMALRMLGVKIPGLAAHASPQKAIMQVRRLAGALQENTSTTNVDLENALNRAGTQTTELTDFGSVKASVLAGNPVILNGNPRNPGAYGWSFPASKMVPYNGAHWIVVSGFDQATGKFIINDPLSMSGAVEVTPRQLDAYRGGSMGIEVSPS